MKLYKEIAKMREEIERNKSTTIKSYGGEGADIERFITLISHGWNCGNAMKFAIRRKRLRCADEIFKILTTKVRKRPQIWYILQPLNRDIARLARTANVHVEGTIVNAIKNEHHISAMFLLESLTRTQRYDVIQKKEECEDNCRGNAHGEGCRTGYDLLMLALETSPEYDFLPSYIVDFVCQHQDPRYKMEIAVGKQATEIYNQTSNGIRLAATNGKTELVIKLLKECLPPDHRYRAFLEVGPPTIDPQVSAMASMLEDNDMEILEMLWKENQGKVLRETLKNSAGMHNNFLELKMTQNAIMQLKKIQALKYNYLIPKPSELSRPMALICYNTFAGTDRFLNGAEDEANCLQSALESLGWGEDEIETFPAWTFNQLIDRLKASIEMKGNHCSLFLLYITSHGTANRVCGIPERGEELSSGPISDIIKTVKTLLPTFIPKVLIFDTCRIGGRTTSHTTTDKNTFLLYPTVLGRGVQQHLYIRELANKITEWADCRVSFQGMHWDAANSMELQGLNVQTPQNDGTAAKQIVLRRYDGNGNNCSDTDCREDIKSCYTDCVICSRCFRWYHLTCAGHAEDDLRLGETSTYKVICNKCKEYEEAHRC